MALSKDISRTPTLRLDGTWQIAIDRKNEGREQKWFTAPRPECQPAPVPGIAQHVFPKDHGVFWYYRTFNAPDFERHERLLLKFGAVDYAAEVWVNGQSAGSHEGPETPFEFDITPLIKRSENNLLAVRVLNPCYERIDGMVLNETPHRNKRCVSDYASGWGYNFGGFLLGVELTVVPALRIADLFPRPDCASGSIPLTLTIHNETQQTQKTRLRIRVAPAAGGQAECEQNIELSIPAGKSSHEVALSVTNPRLWELEAPFLYRLTAETSAGEMQHDFSVRTGFRDFRVINGFFQLNGKRIFLKSTHTGNHVPINWVVEPEAGLLRRDLMLAKTAGYNMVRFIAGMPYPEQLDLCDELGLMVYEECYAAWCLENSPQMGARYDLCMREMVLRDRNHPSVTIWGLLNETFDGPVFRHAVGALKLIRENDPTRLTLLSSGRWDGDPTIGSVSNPGSNTWENQWGIEGTATEKRSMAPHWNPAGGYVFDTGDAHTYPNVPIQPHVESFLRTLGKGAKPVFLSEFGIGSVFNAVDELKPYDRYPGGATSFDRGFIQSIAERYVADFERWGFGSVYPFPEDLLRESYRRAARHRRVTFDLLRSNAQICGYNLTGMLDHGLSGEGIWTFWRAWKPEHADTLQDGFSPLRWCLFADPLFGYAGRPMTVEAVLANDNVLKPGEYPVVFRVFGTGRGKVWEKRTPIVIPKENPLAIPVLKEKLDLNLSPGEYTFAACLEKSGNATGDRLLFKVADSPVPLQSRRKIQTVGLGAKAEAWLSEHGVSCAPFNATKQEAPELVLVGAENKDFALWPALRSCAERGATVIYLSAKPFMAKEKAERPLGDEVKAHTHHDWLYHKEIALKNHALFDGLPAGQLLDWYTFGRVTTSDVFECERTPDDIHAAWFVLGIGGDGYAGGMISGAYKTGRGRILFSSLHVLENLGENPVADRLMMNILKY